MLIATGALLFLAIAVTFVDWRRFLFAAIPVALLQDPIRKLVVGQPVSFVMLVGVVAAAGGLIAMMSGVSLMPTSIRGWRRNIGTPFAFFLAVLLLQALNAFARFGTLVIPAIGLLTYLTPFVALSLVYQAVIRSKDDFLPKFVRVYVVCVSLALLTVGVQYLGYDWPVLGEVGLGLYIYDQGTIMSAFSGLFRSSEIAAWHAATCVCFLIILAVARGMTPGRAIGTAVLVLVIIGLGMLTGRRKFLIEIAVFGACYLSLLLYFGRGAVRIALLSSVIGVLGFVALALVMPAEKTKFSPFDHTDPTYEAYVERSKTVFKDVPERVTDLGLAPIGWAYNQFGFFGAGLGVGTQGVQHFGTAMVEGAAEGGLGKIMVELGALGLIIVIWLGLALWRYIWVTLKIVSQLSGPLSRIALGLASFLVANVAAFSVATQAYSDFFILLLIGTALGALLAMPVLAERAVRSRVLRLTPAARGALAARSA